MLRNEAQFQAVVGEHAKHLQVLCYHTHDSRRSVLGFPDCTLVGRDVMFRELKMTRRSVVRPDQKVWLRRLRAAGADADIWYAEDYHSGRVVEEIRSLAPRDAAPYLTAGARVRRPPLAMRVAKRLYVAAAGADAPKAALLWEAGVASVDHDQWISRAQQALVIIADELPATDEHADWLAAHDLSADADLAAVIAAIRSDLKTPAGAGMPPAGGRSRPQEGGS